MSTLTPAVQLDVDFLGKWIQAQHLTPEAVAQTRQEFESHPARILRLQEFLRPEIAARLAAYLRDETDYEQIRHLYSLKNLKVSDEQWQQAPDEDRLLQFSQMTGVKDGNKPSINPFQYAKFWNDFHDERFAQFLRAMTGLDLTAPSSFVANSLGTGDFIRWHNDVHADTHTRRLAFIVYLNPNWQPDFGGALRMRSRDGQESVWPVEYNSLACFDVLGHKEHEVEIVTSQAGDERRASFNGWFAEADAATSAAAA